MSQGGGAGFVWRLDVNGLPFTAKDRKIAPCFHGGELLSRVYIYLFLEGFAINVSPP